MTSPASNGERPQSQPTSLAGLRQRYANVSEPSLPQVYSDAWERCKLERSGRPPRAEQIQVLVAAWKALRKP